MRGAGLRVIMHSSRFNPRAAAPLPQLSGFGRIIVCIYIGLGAGVAVCCLTGRVESEIGDELS